MLSFPSNSWQDFPFHLLLKLDPTEFYKCTSINKYDFEYQIWTCQNKKFGIENKHQELTHPYVYV